MYAGVTKSIKKIGGTKTARSVVSLLLCAWALYAQNESRKPVDPVRMVIAAFDRFNLVGLGERHGVFEDSQFRLRLIRDPEFSRKVNDVVIEFGNPRYPSVLDQFVGGEDVSHAELSKVWQDTTQRGSGIWNSPIYEDLIVAVRSVNAISPPKKRLRVLAGDYPIDWSELDVEKAKPFPRFDVIQALWGKIDRDVAAANVIRREVLDKNRKALVIFGGNHFFRNDPRELVNQFKEDLRARWFSINPISGEGIPDVIAAHAAGPDKPILLMATGRIGNLYAGYLAMDVKGWDASPDRVKVRQLVDALLYFGTTPPIVINPPASPR